MSVKDAINIADLRELARKRLPRMVFDYIDGGADDETTLRWSETRFNEYRLVWDALVDIDTLDLSTRVLGQDIKLPFFISPTALQRMFHHDGECAVAAAATKRGTAYSLSTMGTVSLEEIASICPGPKFFQAYVWKDRGLLKDVLARAKAAGFAAVALTVDVPIGGNRERDPRNKFTVPPPINFNTVVNMLSRPEYLYNMAAHPRPTVANFTQFTSMPGGVVGFINEQFDRTVTWKDAEWMRDVWGGEFAIKGITHAADARRCADMGAAAWISNHGGRQLDTSPATIDVLEEVVEAVDGRVDVILDGGVRRGTDIVKAIALGAKAVAIGRAYLFGLAAGGGAGVERALTILEEELRRDMMLLGCPRVRDLEPRFVRKPV
jgi:L-lactate dehydrogenase (cytochrome)